MSALVDPSGRRIKPTTCQNTAEAVVYMSDDEGQTWVPVKPYNVPDTIKTPDTMSYMLAGEIIETVGGNLYRAVRVAA